MLLLLFTLGIPPAYLPAELAHLTLPDHSVRFPGGRFVDRLEKLYQNAAAIPLVTAKVPRRPRESKSHNEEFYQSSI